MLGFLRDSKSLNSEAGITLKTKFYVANVHDKIISITSVASARMPADVMQK